MKAGRATPAGRENRPALSIVQATHASLEGLESVGLFERHRKLVQAYAAEFAVCVYSSDTRDFGERLGVRHRRPPWRRRRFFWGHALYYLWLVWIARSMRGAIKVFGSNIPTLGLVRRLSRCPMMVTYQWDYARQTRMNEGATLKGALAPWLEKLALRPADLVLVTAPWLEEKVVQVYKKRCVLLPNWVDLEAVEEARGRIPRAAGLIVYAGRLHRSKGISHLLRAFARLAPSHPQAELLICGEGEERGALEAEARDLGLAGARFAGRLTQDEVLGRMCAAEVFVLPTLTMEGHPKALIEAMACGAACVVSAIPGSREILRDGENGLLVAPGDAVALASALRRLLDDPALRRRLGEAAARAAAPFAFSAIVPREIAALKALLAGSEGERG